MHLVYAGLFAFVLPFVCWGAQGTPDHPHRIAHFVFVEPHTVEVTIEKLIGRLQTDDKHSATHLAQTFTVGQVQEIHRQKIDNSPQTEKPSGRSVPAILLISLLILLEIGSNSLPFLSERPNFASWLILPHLTLFHLLVRTPPPRKV